MQIVADKRYHKCMNNSCQADIRNPLSLLAHNQITALRFVSLDLYPQLTQETPPTRHLVLHALEAGDFLDLVKLRCKTFVWV